jgi:uncharacterized protein (TIGR03437 family)
MDTAGNLYISQNGNDRIRQVSPSGIISSIGLGGGEGYSGDGGLAGNAQFSLADGLAGDSAGNLYISDSGNNRIRMVSPGGTVTTIAGNGVPGYSGDGGLATLAELSGPAGIAVSPSGNLYVADADNGAVRLLQPAPPPTIAVTNAASNRTGVLAPGELVTIYGSGMGPSQGAGFTLSSQQTVGTQLAGTQVLVNGAPSPVLYASAGQVNAIVPFATTGGPGTVQVQYQGQTVVSQSVTTAASAPGLFSRDGSGSGQAAALNQDSSPNSASNPAVRGSVIVLYATGYGQSTPLGVDGSLATSPYGKPQLSVQVLIGGQQATVQYAGAAPMEVAGVMQINAVIPATVTPGSAVTVSVSIGFTEATHGLSIGGVGSQGGVTIAVSN